MTMTTMKRLTVGVVMAAALMVAAVPAGAQSVTAGRVRAFQIDSWNVWVSAGWHQVTVDGDRSTDLDLYVVDAAGRLLGCDEDDTDFAVTSFYMPRSGYIQVRIRNFGRVYNDYDLIVR